MKKSNLLILRLVLSLALLLGLAINIAAWNIVVPAEFGIAVGVMFIFPSSIFNLGTLIFIVISSFDKKSTVNKSVMLTVVSLAIPALLGVIVVKDINRKWQLSSNPAMKAYMDFENNNVPPIQNGLWYYPSRENPIAILNFFNGRSEGKHEFFDPTTYELESMKFYDDGKLDSIYRYFQNKLAASYHSQNAQEKFDTIKYYQYDKDQMSRMIIFYRETGHQDTVLVSDLN
jgi:hypothetical protein